MSTFEWIVLIAVAWLGAAALVGVLLGKLIRQRDLDTAAEIDSVVRFEMNGIDHELDQLLGGRS